MGSGRFTTEFLSERLNELHVTQSLRVEGLITRSIVVKEEMASSQRNVLPSCPRRERPNIVPSRSVCRQLFGPNDHEQLRADLLRDKRKLLEEATRTWNFDFENGIPLVGRYVWERMFSDLTREIEASRFSSPVSEIETSNERSETAAVAERADVTPSTTTSLGTTDRTISDDIDSDKLESGKCYSGKSARQLRKRKTTGKITDFLRPRKQRKAVKRSRLSRKKSTSNQTSMDVFVRKH
ncbi:cyclin-dependent kinase inhibitor 1-like isoform X1 [Montipora foliosa]|uniref:cyclin-dependent kinase inhibitor 1-like isoform X1 n=2 Tax=Montipora foliosa TaxID=591990 RepID=UPI0035F20F6F